MTDKVKLIVIEGATASGKTTLSIQVAKAVNGEIISSDSMQIYKKMDIGTSKVTLEEMDGIPHHMIDIVDVNDQFSVTDYVKMVDEKIADIAKRGKVPIICGGTGFYIDGILKEKSYGCAEPNLEVREKYKNLLKTHGKEYIFNLLKEVDEESFNNLHLNDTNRIIRALEIFETTGRKKSEIVDEIQYRYNFDLFCLELPREKLYERMNFRVDLMAKKGLVEEVKEILEISNDINNQSLKAIGYKEIIPYINGEKSLEECLALLKKNTRHYGKRQMTWFRHQGNPIMIDMTLNLDENVKKIKDIYFLNKE